MDAMDAVDTVGGHSGDSVHAVDNVDTVDAVDTVNAIDTVEWSAMQCSGVGIQWSGNAVEWECSGVNAFMQWMQLGDPHNDLSPSSRCTVDAVDTVGGHSGCNEYSGCS